MSPAVKSSAQGTDGFYHPKNEAELKALIVRANRRGVQLRVRGSSHSVSHVIYTDPLRNVVNRVGVETAPEGDGINVALDRYRGMRVRNAAKRIIEVDAGARIGPDPSDPTATFERSILGRIWAREWMLSNLGGITHQTIGGFTATGSSGGSVKRSLNDNIVGFRYIDAKGRIHAVDRDREPEKFLALCPNLGLLGVVSTVTLKCERWFNITGQEATTTPAGEDCTIDLFGDGEPGRPSLKDFLSNAEYARIEWWPQRGAERVQIWQAQRIKPQPGFKPTRYQQFTAMPRAAETLISIIYSILGNLQNLTLARPQLVVALEDSEAVEEGLVFLRATGLVGEPLVTFIATALQVGVDVALAQLQPLAGAMETSLPAIFSGLFETFIRLDSSKIGDEQGEPQSFRDWGWRGLPMDNEASDRLLPVSFTELWLPLLRTKDAMRLLREYFEEPETVAEAYERTGLFGWELYAAKPNEFWLNASHTDKADEWRDGVLRIDPFWFNANPGDPTLTFYPPLWNRFKESGIPFRLHWGKYQPRCTQQDPAWAVYFSKQYPKWNQFLNLRRQRDPKGIFLTSYWVSRLGLWSDPTGRY
jgi:D-arabinono-1,4-lactone oxidase